MDVKKNPAHPGQMSNFFAVFDIKSDIECPLRDPELL